MTSPPKVWFITGCSSGLGAALAVQVLHAGQRVLATARQADSLRDLAERFPETCRSFTLDVTDAGQVKATIRDAAAAFGQIDVLVNNAGYGLVGALEECSEEQIARTFETNLFGPMRVIRAVLPIFRQQRAGHVINISAAAAISNYPGFSVYGAAKCALEGISESLAQELKPLGIKVTVVQPGPFRTDFISRSLERGSEPHPDYAGSSGKFAAFLEKMDGSQSGDPEKAAGVLLRLAEMERPPFRVQLGKYAVEKALKTAETRRREAEAWKDLGQSTDFA